jgi:hypothetical protein
MISATVCPPLLAAATTQQAKSEPNECTERG